jgi:hypothetical protein
MDMDREGLSKVRRAELVARLSALDKLIGEQASRAKYIREMGWNVTLADERLKLLKESRQLYASALKHLLGDDFADSEESSAERVPRWLSSQ